MEFAIVAPWLVVLLLGVYDLSNALITYEQVYSAAHSMAASISSAAVYPDGTNQLTYTQIQQAESILWAEVPALRSGMQSGVRSVTVSSIVFEPVNVKDSSGNSETNSYYNTPSTSCSTGNSATACYYVPVVAWSVAYAGGNSGTSLIGLPNTTNNKFVNGSWTTLPYQPEATSNAPLRSCDDTAANTPNAISSPSGLGGALNQTDSSHGSPSDLLNLRTKTLTSPDDASPAPPSPIIVVDVQLQYTPVIGLIIGKSFPIWVNGYWPVRSVQVSTGSAVPLTEEFATLTPVPTGTGVKPPLVTPTHLSDYAGSDVDRTIVDNDGNAVPTTNYCVNTTLFSLYGTLPETK